MIKSFLGPFLLTFTIAMIVLLLQFVWKWIDELVGKGLEWSVILELLAYVSARLIPMAMILGILLASIMTFGNLGEQNELTALKSSGISLIKMMYPIFGIILLFGAGTFAFSNYIIPVTNMKFYTLLLDIRQQRPEFDILEGQFYNGIEGYSLYIGDRSKDGKVLYDLKIYDHTKDQGNVSVTMADSGNMRITEDKKNLILTLFSGQSYAEELSDDNKIQDNKPFRRDKFQSQQVLFNLPGSELNRTSEDLFRNHYQMLNMRQLRDTANALEGEMIWRRNKLGHELIEQQFLRMENKKEAREDPDYYEKPDSAISPNEIIDTLPVEDKREIYTLARSYANEVQSKLNNSKETLQSRKRWINMYRNEFNRMMTFAMACLVFFFIGAPLGAIIRKGGLGMPVVVSVLFFIAYYIITLAGEKYARAAFIPSWLGMWSSTFILLPFGFFLIYKSNKDSKIMVGESYARFFNKILSFVRLSRKRRNEDPANHQ
jgi:lipopolysaccharide export system permease protein